MDGPVVHTQGQNIVVMGKLMAEEPFHLVEGGKLRNQQQERGVEKNRFPQRYVPSDQLSPSRQLPSNNPRKFESIIGKALH